MQREPSVYCLAVGTMPTLPLQERAAPTPPFQKVAMPRPPQAIVVCRCSHSSCCISRTGVCPRLRSRKSYVHASTGNHNMPLSAFRSFIYRRRQCLRPHSKSSRLHRQPFPAFAHLPLVVSTGGSHSHTSTRNHSLPLLTSRLLYLQEMAMSTPSLLKGIPTFPFCCLQEGPWPCIHSRRGPCPRLHSRT